MINTLAPFLGTMLNIKHLLNAGSLPNHDLRWDSAWDTFSICALSYCISYKDVYEGIEM